MGTPCFVYFTDGRRIEAIVHHTDNGDTESFLRDYARFVAEVRTGRCYKWDEAGLLAARWVTFMNLDMFLSFHRLAHPPASILEVLGTRLVHHDDYGVEYIHRIDVEHNGNTRPPMTRSHAYPERQQVVKRGAFWSAITTQESPLSDVSNEPLLQQLVVDVSRYTRPKEGQTGLEPTLQEAVC